jgi:hypothetical protein
VLLVVFQNMKMTPSHQLAGHGLIVNKQMWLFIHLSFGLPKGTDLDVVASVSAIRHRPNIIY